MDKKQIIQQAFDTVASGYDHPSLPFFPVTAKKIVEHLSLNNNESLLDVCCGTGVVSIQAASELTAGSVTGIDLSSGMLEQAKTKAEQQNLGNVEFRQMDLDQLSFEDESFDTATCSFGLFFLDDMKKGLNNIATKVRPGGKIAISTFSHGAFEPMSSHFMNLYEQFGYDAPPRSWQHLCEDGALEALFNSAGIEQITIHSEPLGLQLESAENWWDVVWNAGYRGLLMQMSADEQLEFEQQHLQEIQEIIDAGNNWMSTGVTIVVAEK